MQSLRRRWSEGKNEGRNDERRGVSTGDLYDRRLSGRLLFYLVLPIAIRLDRFASARHVKSVVAILLLFFSNFFFFLAMNVHVAHARSNSTRRYAALQFVNF